MSNVFIFKVNSDSSYVTTIGFVEGLHAPTAVKAPWTQTTNVAAKLRVKNSMLRRTKPKSYCLTEITAHATIVKTRRGYLEAVMVCSTDYVELDVVYYLVSGVCLYTIPEDEILNDYNISMPLTNSSIGERTLKSVRASHLDSIVVPPVNLGELDLLRDIVPVTPDELKLAWRERTNPKPSRLERVKNFFH